MARTFDLHDWHNRSNAWYLKHRRFWIHSVNPIGPSEARITEDGILRETEDGQTRVTEGF